MTWDFVALGAWICTLIRPIGRCPWRTVRTVKTASGATAGQMVHSTRRGSRDIEHLRSAHDEAELEALKAAARQRLAQDQLELDLGLEAAAGRVRWR